MSCWGRSSTGDCYAPPVPPGSGPAQALDDDVILYEDETRQRVRAKIHTLRQQSDKTGDRANLALADFVAPEGRGIADWAGAFVVTTGLGLDELVSRFDQDHDDYRAILARSLADRLAEAFAEWMHAHVRTEDLGLRQRRPADPRRSHR